MEHIDSLFDRMDAWRHLPNYQLEGRADLFFSLYLPEVLETKLGFTVQDQLVPEFPVRIGTIYPNGSSNKACKNLSCKIDYVAISTDGEKAVLFELKPESLSRRDAQDNTCWRHRPLAFLPCWEVCSIFSGPQPPNGSIFVKLQSELDISRFASSMYLKSEKNVHG